MNKKAKLALKIALAIVAFVVLGLIAARVQGDTKMRNSFVAREG